MSANNETLSSPAGALTSNVLKARIEILRRWAPFDHLDGEHLDWAAGRFEEIRHSPGSILLQPGQRPDAFHFIVRGNLRVEAMGRSQHNKILAELSEGGCFPIEAMHEQRPVFSTFRAVEEVITWRLDEGDFTRLQEMSGPFSDFCEGRSATLLEQSRQLYQSQFAYNRPDRQSLDSPVGVLAEADPVVCAPTATLRDVVEALDESGSGTMVVIDGQRRPVGVYTLRSLVQDMARNRYVPDDAVETMMNRAPVILTPQTFGYDAAMAMAKTGVRHVLVVGERGELQGIIHERDLFGLQRVGLSQISETIRRSRDIQSIQRCAGDIRQLAHNLIEQGVGSEQLTQLISTLNDQLTQRIIDMEVAAHVSEGHAVGDLSFCWVAFGSEGRHEQTLSTDQDNGIVFAVPEGQGAEEVRRRLLPLALRINQQLDACGYTLCKGNIMASNPECCLSLEEWQGRFRRWIDTPTPEALLAATIFFDFRPLHGAMGLAVTLREWLCGAAKSAGRLQALLVEHALERSPPLGLIRDFVTNADGCIDLKLSGITLFVDCARLLALAAGVGDSGTKARLRQAALGRKVPATEIDAWENAFQFLQLIRLRSQHEQHVRGEEMDNLVNPNQLDAVDRKILIESLRQAGKLQKRVQGWLGVKQGM